MALYPKIKEQTKKAIASQDQGPQQLLVQWHWGTSASCPQPDTVRVMWKKPWTHCYAFCWQSKHIKVRNIRGFVAKFCSAHFWEPWWRVHTWVYLRCVRNTSSTEVNRSLSILPVQQKTLLLYPARPLRVFQYFKASHPFMQDQNIENVKSQW